MFTAHVGMSSSSVSSKMKRRWRAGNQDFDARRSMSMRDVVSCCFCMLFMPSELVKTWCLLHADRLLDACYLTTEMPGGKIGSEISLREDQHDVPSYGL